MLNASSPTQAEPIVIIGLWHVAPLLHESKNAGASRRWVLGKRVGCLSRDANLLAPKPKTNLHLQRQNEGQQKHVTTMQR